MDNRECSVTEFWRAGHLGVNTIQVYLQWVRRFREYCLRLKIDDVGELSCDGVRRFVSRYAGPRLGKRVAARSGHVACNALHAWSCALRALGMEPPPWRAKRESPGLPPLLEEFVLYRKAHNGVSDGTLGRDIETARAFLALLKRRKRPLGQVAVRDLDMFIRKCAARFSTSTVADTCSSLRGFLRFLQAAERVTADLAASVMGPRFRRSQRPPRTLPWNDVRRVLKSIDRKHSPGKRDYAVTLLLATYGLGAAEVLALRLGDIDWKGSVIRTVRPKTKTVIELPLLPAVARALADYLRRERPPAKGIVQVFLRKRMPYAPLTSSAIRHRIRHWASIAGIESPVLGAHVFRHSHATRQVDAGANHRPRAPGCRPRRGMRPQRPSRFRGCLWKSVPAVHPLRRRGTNVRRPSPLLNVAPRCRFGSGYGQGCV
jgi:integrase